MVLSSLPQPRRSHSMGGVTNLKFPFETRSWDIKVVPHHVKGWICSVKMAWIEYKDNNPYYPWCTLMRRCSLAYGENAKHFSCSLAYGVHGPLCKEAYLLTRLGLAGILPWTNPVTDVAPTARQSFALWESALGSNRFSASLGLPICQSSMLLILTVGLKLMLLATLDLFSVQPVGCSGGLEMKRSSLTLSDRIVLLLFVRL